VRFGGEVVLIVVQRDSVRSQVLAWILMVEASRALVSIMSACHVEHGTV
jgi:hypothetical protein